MKTLGFSVEVAHFVRKMAATKCKFQAKHLNIHIRLYLACLRCFSNTYILPAKKNGCSSHPLEQGWVTFYGKIPRSTQLEICPKRMHGWCIIFSYIYMYFLSWQLTLVVAGPLLSPERDSALPSPAARLTGHFPLSLLGWGRL
jgi:hypothetical protein